MKSFDLLGMIFSFRIDYAELESLPPTCQVTQPDPSDLSQLTVTISPDQVKIKIIEILLIIVFVTM